MPVPHLGVPQLGVLGAGSFGTALAVTFAAGGKDVLLWARRQEVADELARTRVNARYLATIELPSSVEVTHELDRLANLETVLMVVPSQGFRSVLAELLARRRSAAPLRVVSAVKGIELDTAARMSEIAAEESAKAGIELRYAALSGPNFAIELAEGKPSLAVIAGETMALADQLQEELSTSSYRLYSSTDVVGVEVGGAAKNVIAIAAGVLTGLGFGHNTMAALITRGLHEMTRLGVASGGELATFSGLAGLGDLVLTCTGGLSRNRATGEQLAQGKSLAEIEEKTSMVSEGVKASLSIVRLAERVDVEIPITSQMVDVMYHQKPAREALEELMGRELKREASL